MPADPRSRAEQAEPCPSRPTKCPIRASRRAADTAGMGTPAVSAVEWVTDPSADQLEAVAALVTGLQRTVDPAEPAFPAAELRSELTEAPPYEEVSFAVVEKDDRVVGAAVLHLDRSGSNRHLAWLQHLLVETSRRRSGIGTRLLKPRGERAVADGRTVLVHGAPAHLTGTSAFAERVGARPGLIDRQNRLDVASLERGLLESWVARSAERAEGYSLIAFDGRCPDDLVEEFARLAVVMDTAPHSEVWEPSVITPETLHGWQDAFARRGGLGWTLCARHDETARLVGYSWLGFLPYRPWLAHQGDTGVEPEHRDRGLGRWLKATNASACSTSARRSRSSRPGTRRSTNPCSRSTTRWASVRSANGSSGSSPSEVTRRSSTWCSLSRRRNRWVAARPRSGRRSNRRSAGSGRSTR